MATKDQVAEFLEFTGGMCDERTAEDFIRGNETFEKAVQAFFDDPNPQKYREGRTWTDSAFSAGKDGARSQMDELPPYQMEDDDRAGRTQLRPLGAPSRPPSRDKSRISLRSGRDTSMDMVQYGPHQPPDDELDAELREAIRLSMEDQQTGTIIAATGREYVPDVDPSYRRRLPGEPAFLKPLPSNPFLPALVTILHSLPQCRELLLSKADLLIDYGENKRWWQGEHIETTRIIDIESDTDAANQLDVIHEVQRLMAFLDVTDRAYGSVEALAHLEAVSKGTSGTLGTEPAFVRFMRSWQAAADRARTDYQVDYPFRSAIKGAQECEVRQIYCVDIGAADIPIQASPSLYDVLDNCFWPNGAIAEESSLGHVAPIMVMRLTSLNKPTQTSKLTIPATLYADRYMESNKELLKQMRADVVNHNMLMEDYGDQIANIDLFQYSTSTNIGNASKLLDSAVKLLNSAGSSADTIMEADDGEEKKLVEEDEALPAGEVLSRLEQIYAQIRREIESTTEQQALIKESAARLKALLTDPNAEESPKPVKAYQLRGVGIATPSQSNVTYIMYSPPLEPFTGFASVPDWWRMSYDTVGDKALVSKERVSEKTVLDAAGELLSETLLVYVSTEMLADAPDEPLPQQLQEFVALDNAAFRSELEGSPPPTDIRIIEGQPFELSSDPGPVCMQSSNSIPRTILSPPTPPLQEGDTVPMMIDTSVWDRRDLQSKTQGASVEQKQGQEMQEVPRSFASAPFVGGGAAAGRKRSADEQGSSRVRGGETDPENGTYNVQDSDTDSSVGEPARRDSDVEMQY